MLKYIMRRLLLLFPVVLAMTLITFVISHAVPGDPARLAAGIDASAEQVERVRHELGLDRSLPEQYFIYLRNLLTGDLGMSIHTRRPVADDIARFFPATFELTIVAMLLALTLGITLGIVSALKRGSWVDSLARLTAILNVSMPVFWSGLLLQLVFYRILGWLPAGGRLDWAVIPPQSITGLYLLDSLLTGNMEAFTDTLRHIILPALALAPSTLAVITRMTRSSMLDVMRQDYIRTAHAKGLPSRVVTTKHAMRNAAIPILTAAGLQFGSLLGGAFLTETIFFWPGLGQYAVQSITTLDFSAIMGVAVLTSVVFVLVNLLTDVLYVFIDPRIKY